MRLWIFWADGQIKNPTTGGRMDSHPPKIAADGAAIFVVAQGMGQL
jgi:hypothetical protein